MTEERRHPILFAATFLSARTLLVVKPDKPNMAIVDAAFILERDR
jgi:hypothetical protein